MTISTLQTTLQVAIRRLPGNEDLPLPSYQSQDAACMDLYAAVPHPSPAESAPPALPNQTAPSTTLAPGQIAVIPCGFSLAIPTGYEAQIRPRSGLAAKHGISMPNTPGTIDSDYRGQIMVPLVNLGSQPFVVTRGMRIAQMVIKPVPRVQWLEVAELPLTPRGSGGFGHTGR